MLGTMQGNARPSFSHLGGRRQRDVRSASAQWFHVGFSDPFHGEEAGH